MSDRAVSRSEREREHFNRLARQTSHPSLKMSKENIRRYTAPGSCTTHELEFAFHLLGDDLCGSTVLELGCGDGLNTVILAALGASVIAVDVSEESLALTAARGEANGVAGKIRLIHASVSELPLGAETVDKVICAAILHHVDLSATASEIHRVLKPGGLAVFLEPVEGPLLFRLLKRVIPLGPEVSPDERPLTKTQVSTVNKLVGVGRRRREFGLTYRVVSRVGLRVPWLERASRRLDAWLLARVRVSRRLASPLVWMAVKPAGSDAGARRCKQGLL